MIYRIIGDIHGDLNSYEKLLTDTPSIQVGDFGYGFGTEAWETKVASLHRSGIHRFIRGNHDDPAKCKAAPGYIPDGFIENNMMFIGGAWSVDANRRVAGVNWWHDEELSYYELDSLLSVYANQKPDIMITHDCPSYVAYKMIIRNGLAALGPVQSLTRTGEAFQSMFELHQPKVWIFGHWHHSGEEVIDGTRFRCVDINDFVELDTETMELREIYEP